MNLTAKVVPFSSMVGSGVTLHDESGAVVGQLALLNTGPMKDDPANPDEWKRRQIAFAEEVAERINAAATKTTMTETAGEVAARLREFNNITYESGIFSDKTICDEAADLIEDLSRRLEAVEGERDEADNALVDKYRDPKTGHFKFPADVAAIVRRLEAAESSLTACRAALEAMLDNYGPPAKVAHLCDYPADHPITLAREVLTTPRGGQ